MYFGNWKNREEMISEFVSYRAEDGTRKSAFDGAEILIASYVTGSWEGDGYVLMRKEGQLLELEGGHCSCYGMEDVWPPQATTVEALKKRKVPMWRDEDEDVRKFQAAWKDLVSAL